MDPRSFALALILTGVICISPAFAQDDRSGANDGGRGGQHDTGNGCCDDQVGAASDWGSNGDDLGGANAGSSVGGNDACGCTSGEPW
jgi:hypothetical protein